MARFQSVAWEGADFTRYWAEVPQTEIDVVRELYRAVNERDWDRAIALWAEDAILEVPGIVSVNAGVFEGRDQIFGWFADWFITFADDASFQLLELSELEDGSILAISEHRATGRSSGVEVSLVVVWREFVENGQIARQIGHTDREEAIAASRTGDRESR